jgi:hypothetical protein
VEYLRERNPLSPLHTTPPQRNKLPRVSTASIGHLLEPFRLNTRNSLRLSTAVNRAQMLTEQGIAPSNFTCIENTSEPGRVERLIAEKSGSLLDFWFWRG